MGTRLLTHLVIIAGMLAVQGPSQADPTPEEIRALEVKRNAAQRLLRENKLDDAAVMLQEVSAAPGANWSDWQNLARLHERLKRDNDAAAAYRKLLELTDAQSRNQSERAARSDAERRLKQLDPLSDKIDTFLADTLKRIDALIAEAEKAGSKPAVERLLDIRGQIFAASSPNRHYFVVGTDGLRTGLLIREGQRVRVRCHGRWTMGDVRFECDADGLPEGRRPAHASGRLYAALLGPKAPVEAPIFLLGVTANFQAPFEGTLTLAPQRNFRMREGTYEGALRVFLEVE